MATGPKPKKHKGKTLKEWALEAGITEKLLRSRLEGGWTLERAVSEPPHTPKLFEGKTLTQWAKESGISVAVLRGRLKQGWTLNEAVTKPVHRAKKFKGKTAKEWMEQASEYSSVCTFWSRVHDQGMTPEEALETPLPAPSSGEAELAELIASCGVEIIRNDREAISPKELDVYVPALALAFEYNGVYWHTESKVGKNSHYDKWKACKEKGIQLVQVWEHDWTYRRPHVERMVKSKLGRLSLQKIPARRTSPDILSFGESRDFLNRHHIQGSATGNVYVGLKFESQLVAVAVFKRMGEEWRLERFATSRIVQGGFSKALSWFTRNYSPERIITFSDHCLSDGALYSGTGWKWDGELAPDYRYLTPWSLELEHKFNFRKERFKRDDRLKFDPTMTESELATLNGLERVYDAGKTRWVYVPDLKSASNKPK